MALAAMFSWSLTTVTDRLVVTYSQISASPPRANAHTTGIATAVDRHR